MVWEEKLCYNMEITAGLFSDKYAVMNRIWLGKGKEIE